MKFLATWRPGPRDAERAGIVRLHVDHARVPWLDAGTSDGREYRWP